MPNFEMGVTACNLDNSLVGVVDVAVDADVDDVDIAAVVVLRLVKLSLMNTFPLE